MFSGIKGIKILISEYEKNIKRADDIARIKATITEISKSNKSANVILLWGSRLYFSCLFINSFSIPNLSAIS